MFEWQGVTHELFQMRDIHGSIPYKKENSVLAIKLNQKEVEERTIRRQEISFIKEKKPLDDKAAKKMAFETEKKSFDPIQFYERQEMRDIYTFTDQSFSWKAGKYSVLFEIEAQDKFNPVDDKYEFNLTSINIENLEKNKALVKQDYLNSRAGKNHEKHKKITWNWATPAFISRKII